MRVDTDTQLMTDEYRSYSGLDKEFASHKTVNHSSGEYARDGVHVNNAESFFSLLKRGHIGVFHKMSETHLQRYADEFEYRWNTRKQSDGQRTVNIIKQVEGKRLMYKDTIKTKK